MYTRVRGRIHGRPRPLPPVGRRRRQTERTRCLWVARGPSASPRIVLGGDAHGSPQTLPETTQGPRPARSHGLRDGGASSGCLPDIAACRPLLADWESKPATPGDVQVTQTHQCAVGRSDLLNAAFLRRASAVGQARPATPVCRAAWLDALVQRGWYASTSPPDGADDHTCLPTVFAVGPLQPPPSDRGHFSGILCVCSAARRTWQMRPRTGSHGQRHSVLSAGPRFSARLNAVARILQFNADPIA